MTTHYDLRTTILNLCYFPKKSNIANGSQIAGTGRKSRWRAVAPRLHSVLTDSRPKARRVLHQIRSRRRAGCFRVMLENQVAYGYAYSPTGRSRKKEPRRRWEKARAIRRATSPKYSQG